MYKHCLKLLERLWRHTESVWIPKEENASDITQFCTISLLSVEGRISLKILANRLTVYLLRNSYIVTAEQKGLVPSMPGYIEHTGVVTQLIRVVRENRGDLAVIWLDLANAWILLHMNLWHQRWQDTMFLRG